METSGHISAAAGFIGGLRWSALLPPVPSPAGALLAWVSEDGPLGPMVPLVSAEYLLSRQGKGISPDTSGHKSKKKVN